MPTPEEATLLEQAKLLQELLIRGTTGKIDAGSVDVYSTCRRTFMSYPTLKQLLPSFVRDNREFMLARQNIMREFGSYADRSEYIHISFHRLLDHLDLLPVTQPHHTGGAPSDELAQSALSDLNSQRVTATWAKALERRSNDPEGAITSARQLLESVIKHVLDDLNVPYGDDDLPKLWKLCSEKLNLAPSQHEEDAFKRILGGCHTVVQTLGEIRNKMGDAHGTGRSKTRPSPRHAALVVNLAGAMAAFIVETHQARSVP